MPTQKCLEALCLKCFQCYLYLHKAYTGPTQAYMNLADFQVKTRKRGTLKGLYRALSRTKIRTRKFYIRLPLLNSLENSTLP